MAQATISPQKRTRIKQLASQGHSKSMIAKLTGLGHGTIDKYVSLDQQRLEPLKTFRSNIGELLNEILMSGMQAQAKVLTSLAGEDVASLQVSEKRQLARDLSVVNGTVFDKIRLHEGKSTSNNSHQIQVQQAHDTIDWSSTSSGSVGKQVADRRDKTCGIKTQNSDNNTEVIDNYKKPDIIF